MQRSPPTIRHLKLPSDNIIKEEIFANVAENDFTKHAIDILLATRHQVVGIVTDPIYPYPLYQDGENVVAVEDTLSPVSKFGGEKPFMCEAYPTYPMYECDGSTKPYQFIGQVMVKTLPGGFMQFPDDLAMIQMFLPSPMDLEGYDDLLMRFLSDNDLLSPIEDFEYPYMDNVEKHNKNELKYVKEWVVHDQFASIGETGILYDYGYDVFDRGQRNPPYNEVKDLYPLLELINKQVANIRFMEEDSLPIIPRGRPRWFSTVSRNDQTRLFSPLGNFAQEPEIKFSILPRSLHQKNINRFFITLDWCRVLGGREGGYMFGDAGVMNVVLNTGSIRSVLQNHAGSCWSADWDCS
ncbi:hypothetical protein PCE1_000093 [Barthelona sp. PCE]